MGEECHEKVCNEGMMAEGLFSCSPSGIFEQCTTYTEPYMDDLNDAVAGVQTDLALGDRLESESLNELDEIGDCSTKIEIPWRAMCLPEPGSYTIKQCKAVCQSITVFLLFFLTKEFVSLRLAKE